MSLSSDVLPEIKEFERTSTTVINAYVMPVVARYLTNLERRLAGMGLEAPLTVMQSSGGTARTGFTKKRPVYSIESGPTAGVIGAAAFGRHLNMPNLISFDMGGTTAKTCLVENGVPRSTSEYEVGGGLNIGHRLLRGGGYLLRVPAIDLAEVGAGGGSIVWIDRGGALRVGPQSAGAAPGPACYRRGGALPTVTDANVALGYLNPGYLVGGELEIDGELANRVLSDEIARPLGLDLESAALGVHTVINSTMVRAVRAVSSEIGRDPKEFVLFAFGGSGPVHSATLAREADIPHVVVPPAPGVFSALGLLFSAVEHQYVHTFWRDLESVDVATLAGHFAHLEREARDTLRDEGFGNAQVVVQRFVDLRYPGQTSDITIEVPDGPLSVVMLGPARRGVSRRAREHVRTSIGRGREGRDRERPFAGTRAPPREISRPRRSRLPAAGARRRAPPWRAGARTSASPMDGSTRPWSRARTSTARRVEAPS